MRSSSGSPQSGKQMLYGRNDEQTEGRPVSSIRISSSKDLCSSSCAVKEQTQNSSSESAINIKQGLKKVLPQTFRLKIFCHMMPPSQMC
jgi:hypothetical protein